MSGLNIQRLRDIFDAAFDPASGTLKTSGGGGGTTSTQRTTGILTTSASGTIALGARSVAIANIGVSTGTVKGVILPLGISIAFDAPSADTLDAIAYNATGTTFLITEVR